MDLVSVTCSVVPASGSSGGQEGSGVCGSAFGSVQLCVQNCAVLCVLSGGVGCAHTFPELHGSVVLSVSFGSRC